MTHVTDEELGKIARQYHDLFRRVREGSLDAHLVSKGLQGVIEGKYPHGLLIAESHQEYEATISPLDRQIEKVTTFLELYGGEEGFRPEDIPTAPDTNGRQLLLTVNLPDRDGDPGWLRTLRDWWQFTEGQYGNTWLWPDFTFDTDHVRLAPGIAYQPGIRWVEYEPNAYAGKSPEQALKVAARNGATLAGAEPLMAAVLLDGYVESWFEDGNVNPNLTAYQFNWEGDSTDWLCVPSLRRNYVQLWLDASWANRDLSDWGSPCLREC